jgi:4-carboxymuconolactone decarboxylase
LARIPLLTPEAMTPAQRKVLDDVTSGPRGTLVGPLRAAIHRPELADVWQRFGALLRFGTSLPPHLSELAILVTARRWNSQLEWHIHAEAARKAGIAGAVIEDLCHGRAPLLPQPDEAEIYAFARELQLYGQVADDTYDRVLTRWGTVGAVELTALIGYYTMVSMTLNAHQLPLPDGATPPLEPLKPAADGMSWVLSSIAAPRLAGPAA